VKATPFSGWDRISSWRFSRSISRIGQITTPTQPGLLVQIMTSGPEGRMPMMTLHAGGGGVNVGAGG